MRLMADRTPLAFPFALANSAANLVKEAIAAQVVSLFSEGSRAYPTRSRNAAAIRFEERLFPPSAVTRRVHGDVTTMMVGGISGLLLQMLHPAVLAGVWDHSSFRADLHGRLRRTARFVAVTTYGRKSDAEAAIARVRQIHELVCGVLPNGAPYAASNPALLAWVHVTETTSFLNAQIRYAEPRMSEADQDRYFNEMARIAAALGADPIPRSRSEAQHLIEAVRPQLVVSARTRQVAQLVLTRPAPNRMAEPVQALGMQAAIDLLPAWARRMHGLRNPPLGVPLVRAGTLGVARTLRWALD
jgi:uncharacterized protein (DUF2236 family)